MIALTYGGVKFFVIAYHRLRKVYLMEYLLNHISNITYCVGILA